MVRAIIIKNEIDIHGQSAGPVFLRVDDDHQLKLGGWMLYSDAEELASRFELPLIEV
jgi:hypothetical protein